MRWTTPAYAMCLGLGFGSPALADLNAIPAQTFTLDPSHSSLIFSVNHLGLSDYTASFDTMSARLRLDPLDPGSAWLEARIDVASLDLPAPPPGFLDEMLGAVWFNVAAHPVMTFTSTEVTLLSETEAQIVGEMTMLGQTADVTLRAQYRASFAAGVIERHPRIGFSAVGTLNRSDFGMSVGIPPEGSDLGVGDAVRFVIEAEFTGAIPTD